MQNHPYFQHPAGSPKFHPAPQNNEFQPNNNPGPRDDYFHASHYTWHHDSDQTEDTNPVMYQTQENEPAMTQGAQDVSPAMFQPWGLHTHELSPAPWGPHTHDVSPAMFQPWGLHTHELSPAPWGPHTHDVSPAMFHPMDLSDYDPHPEGWAHYSVDYHYDWYQHWDDDQRAHDFYPAGYHPWLDYRW